MTTPEDYAHLVCVEMEKRMRPMGVITTAHYDAGLTLIAEAIRQAVAAEREACAKLAEDLFPRINGPGWLSQDMRGATAKNIAAAIRERKDA